MTPYIFDDRCAPEDAAEALLKVYNLGKEERDKRGMKGHDWVMSNEASMSSTAMGKKIGDCIDKAFDKFTPRAKYDIIKIDKLQPKKVTHKLYGY